MSVAITEIVRFVKTPVLTESSSPLASNRMTQNGIIPAMGVK